MRRLGTALVLTLVVTAAPAATATDARAVSKPKDFFAIAGNALAHLQWDCAANDDTTYRVFRADSATGPWTRVVTSPTAQVDVDLPNGRTVWFSVASVLDGRQSGRTAPLSVTPNPTYPLGEGIDVAGYAFKGYPSRAYSAPAVSSTGDRVVFAYDHLGWYDAASGRTKNLKLHSTYDLAMDAAGRFAVLSQFYQGPGVTDTRFRTALIDWKSKEVTELARGASSSVVDISSDARYVAYTTPDSNDAADARVLDRTTGKTLSFADLPNVDAPTVGPLRAEDLALSADGSTVAVLSTAQVGGEPCYNGACVAVWDLATGDVRAVPLAGNPQTVSLDADGSRLATSGREARVIDLGPVAASDQLVWQSDALHAGLGEYAVPQDYTAVSLTRDGAAVAYYTSRPVADNRVGALHVRDLDSGATRTLVVPVATRLPGYPNPRYFGDSGEGATFTADGRYVFSLQATRPGAEPGAYPLRHDVVRWEWALTAPDAG